MKNNEMKKLIIILIPVLLVLIIFLITSPFVKDIFKEKVTDINGKPKTEFSINETAVYKDIHYRITNTEYGDVIQGYMPMDESKTYFALTFEIQNNSKKEQYISNYCILKTEKVTSEEITTSWIGEEMPDRIQAIGEKNTVTYLWEISKDDKALSYWCPSIETDIEFTFDLATN
jgi:hypothetical protein